MAKNVNPNISKEMIDNIKNYGDQISTLKDFVTAVRKRPGMHIGSIGNPGFLNMIREILQNANDEQNKPTSPCDLVGITFDEKTQTTIVEDNGRGIPFGRILDIFEKEYTSSNYDKRPGEYSSGLHGVGAKVTNALSSKFIVESFILGEARKIEFTEGYPWKYGEKPIPNKDNRQGTRISFVPSVDAIGATSLTWLDVLQLVELILPLCVENARIKFLGIDANGNRHEKMLVNKDGILTYFIDTVKTPLIKPIRIFKDTGLMKADVMFTFDTDPDAQTTMFAFCNTCPTKLGTHIDGYYEGIESFFVSYMNRTYLSNLLESKTSKKKKKGKVLRAKPSDIRAGLISVIAAAHLEPIFDGQSKEKLSNEDMQPFMKATVMDGLNQWSKDNPQDFLKICKYLKDVIELRNKTDNEKIKMSNNYSKSALTGLPDKFVAPTGKAGKDDLEFFIMEGDSAGGTAKNNKVNRIQGYFPIRGKLPNAFKWSRAKLLANEEISGLISIIFDGVKEFDINMLGRKSIKHLIPKIKWKKIIIAVDADGDGDHIAVLLLRFFILYLPELVEAGLLYRCQPPLFGMTITSTAKDERVNMGTGKASKRKMKYFSTKKDYINYTLKNFSKTFKVCMPDGTQIQPSHLSKILYDNIDYTYELEKIANRYSVDAGLLESVLLLKDEPYKSMCKKLKSIYRFIDCSVSNNIVIIEGVLNGKYQTLFFGEKLIADCKNIINIMIRNINFAFIINGELTSLYYMMKCFEKSAPASITRYKGLGEMDGPKLFESTLDPNNRTLIQYTVTDIKKEIEEMRYYDNNINILINAIGNLTRQDVLG